MERRKKNDYPEGVDFGEVLYADDTILIGKSHKKVQKVLQEIEEASKEYGLTLNKEKCIHLRINNNNRVEFRNKMKMPTEEDTTYLGAQLNSKCDITRDLNMKIGAATHIWRKLDKLWKGTNNRLRDKINIYNAVVRSKVAYSLETAPLTTAHKKRLDAFQQKGLRQIMGIQPTFIDRSMTNKKVLDYANVIMNNMSSLDEYYELAKKEGEAHKPKIVKLSEYIQGRAIAHIGHIFRADTKDPVRKVLWKHKSPKETQEGENKDVQLNLPEKFRVGRPRTCWIRTHLEIIWDRYKYLGGYEGKFQFRSQDHLNHLEDMAMKRLF